MRDELYPEMFEMEQRHWWFAAKHRIVADLLRRYVRRVDGQTPRVADLGCGCGMMAYKLQQEGRYEVIGLDGAPQAIQFCAQRGVKVEQGFLPTTVPLPRGAFDAVLLLDVLEHLDEDRASAEVAADLLKPGGVLICTVPAYKWLWSKRDEHHEHRRRYATPEFRALFNQPTLHVELLTHMNTWLFPAAAAARLAARLRATDGMTDLRVPSAPINALLRTIFASERFLLGRLPLPFGLSLVGVARKK